MEILLKNPTAMSAKVWKALLREDKHAVLSATKKYGGNKWWLSKDPVEVARYQQFEPRLLVSFSLFHEGVEKILGRPVFTHEFGLNKERLDAEVKRALRERDAGTFKTPTKAEVAEKVGQALDMAEKFASQNRKVLIYVDPSVETIEAAVQKIERRLKLRPIETAPELRD